MKKVTIISKVTIKQQRKKEVYLCLFLTCCEADTTPGIAIFVAVNAASFGETSIILSVEDALRWARCCSI